LGGLLAPLLLAGRPSVAGTYIFLWSRGRPASASSVDTDAQAWQSAVVANGGTVSDSTLSAVSEFCKSAKTDGYWASLTRINLFCGDQLAAALVPLKVGGGNSTDTNMNFVPDDYAEATGLTGDGSTKYLKTGIIPSTMLNLNSTHGAVYNRSSTAAAGGVHIGATDGTNPLRYHMPFTDGNSYVDEYNNANGRVNTSVTVSAPYGFMVGTRTSASSHVIYRNGSSIASNSTSASIGSLEANELYVFAGNSSGSAVALVAQPLAAYSIGAGLSPTDVTNFNTAMQTFQTALGRNV
jgi:hypothetical protein